MSHRADVAAKILADRHYNRQKSESPQFVPPGSCAVFLTECMRAFWVTSAPFAEYTKHEWAGAWVCSAFRSEGAGVASELIRNALACSRHVLGNPPSLGLVTFINRSKVRPVKVRGVETWGRTWLLAGFEVYGETKGGLLALGIPPSRMPEPIPPLPAPVDALPLFNHALAD
jgi:hypothetical protein